MKINKNNKISKFFANLYEKLFLINDTPQRVALGLGLGVFSGILPGTGPLVALFLSFVLRANRASALIGCLLTNTWLSFVTFILAIKTGSAILGLDWQKILQDWNYFLKKFSWAGLFKLSFLKVILPIVAGFLVIAFCLGFLAYLAALIIITMKHKKQVK
jgi:hypothetical protein